MNRIGIPESEQPALLAYLKRTYRYEDGGIVNRRTGRRQKGYRINSGYRAISFSFMNKKCHSTIQRIIWALCYDQLPSQTIDHINGDRQDNRIENLREVSQTENNLNTLLPWEPNKDTGVTGVAVKECGYQSRIQGRNFHFHNPYEAFYWGIACGKRYRAS